MTTANRNPPTGAGSSEPQRVGRDRAWEIFNLKIRPMLTQEAVVRWQVVGSVRRGAPMVKDLEIVVELRKYQRSEQGLFGGVAPGTEPEIVVPLWDRLDAALNQGMIQHPQRKAWGSKLRRFLLDGLQVEIFTADCDNWGAIVAIRTGPGQFSKRLVQGLTVNAMQMRDGYVRKWGEDTIVRAWTEEQFLAMCGSRWIEPRDRIA